MKKHEALKRLIEAAEETVEWMIEAEPGTDQWERGQKLVKTIQEYQKLAISS